MTSGYALHDTLNRRNLLRVMAGVSGVAAGAILSTRARWTTAERAWAAEAPALKLGQMSGGRVALVKTTDRADGVRRALQLLATDGLAGKRVLLKPNLNSADPSPGSTHPDTLRSLAGWLLESGAGQVTIGDRSGMGDTRQIMEQTGTFALGRELGLDVVVFDELQAADWAPARPNGSHWSRGFAVPRLLTDADAVVQTCNLKTHRFGGHFTLSLKNSVGLAAKQVPGQGYNYMNELHGSRSQRQMIAEINAAYQPTLVVMDGVEAFTTGGPDRGKTAPAELILAGTDRIAIDAVGVAVLRLWGTTPEVSSGPIFGQAQIARAVELGLGVSAPGAIELITDDDTSRAYAAEIRAVLDAA
jgi:uncharacterized protein (DUF362 family)